MNMGNILSPSNIIILYVGLEHDFFFEKAFIMASCGANSPVLNNTIQVW